MDFLNSIPKRIRVMLVVVLILISVILGILTYFVFNYMQTNKLDFLLNMGLGLLTGLIVWIVTYLISQWLDQESKECTKEIKSTVDNIDFKTNVIENCVSKESMTLVEQSRNTMKESKYNSLLNNAMKVKISGIACNTLIEELTNNSRHPMLMNLTQKEGIQIEILMSHPKSEFIKMRDLIEGKLRSKKNPCSVDIDKNLTSLENFAEALTIKPLPIKKGNSLRVRLTSYPLDSVITYMKKPKEELLFMGPICCYNLSNYGPLYKITKGDNKSNSNTIFDHYVCNFDHLFQGSEKNTVFILHYNEVCYTDWLLKQSSE